MKKLFKTWTNRSPSSKAAMSPEQWAGVDETCQRLAIDRRELFRRSWLHFEETGHPDARRALGPKTRTGRTSAVFECRRLNQYW